MATRHIPEGYHTVTPYLIVHGADRLIEFLKAAFDAEELGRFQGPNGTVMHAAVRIVDSVIEMSEASGEYPQRTGTIHLYVKDVDAIYGRALTAGGASLQEPTDQFYGDREASVEDPFGNHWFIATHVRDVSEEEMATAQEEMAKQAEPALS